MTRTSFYVSQFNNNASKVQSSILFNDELFGTASPKEMKGIQAAKRQAILKWLKDCSNDIPNISEGLDKSIVSWFLQSAYLLPKLLKLPVVNGNENSTELQEELETLDVKDCIELLIQNKVLSRDTILRLKHTINDLPLPESIWCILDDVHKYAVEKQNITVPLTKTAGKDRPVILQRNVINNYLAKLRLPPLPTIEEAQKPILDNPFRSGLIYINLYIALTNDKEAKTPPILASKQARATVEKGLSLLIRSNFLDDSFTNSCNAIVNGDMLVIQQVLSNVIFNSSRSGFVIKQKQPTAQNDDTSLIPDPNKKPVERTFLKTSKISDGVSLVKLLTCIDPEFSKVECIFAKPENEVEKKWNTRKAIEYLQKRDDWSVGVIDSSLLFAGETNAINALYKGLLSSYSSKFASLSSIMNLKEILGMDTTQI